jgi:hypothetical protein
MDRWKGRKYGWRRSVDSGRISAFWEWHFLPAWTAICRSNYFLRAHRSSVTFKEHSPGTDTNNDWQPAGTLTRLFLPRWYNNPCHSSRSPPHLSLFSRHFARRRSFTSLKLSLISFKSHYSQCPKENPMFCCFKNPHEILDMFGGFIRVFQPFEFIVTLVGPVSFCYNPYNFLYHCEGEYFKFHKMFLSNSSHSVTLFEFASTRWLQTRKLGVPACSPISPNQMMYFMIRVPGRESGMNMDYLCCRVEQYPI